MQAKKPKISPIRKAGQPKNRVNLVPLGRIAGYDVRPGFYEVNGATAIPCGVNFTVHSIGATACELLLFHRAQAQPAAVLPFPAHYRIGDVWSMIVFGLDIYEFEYAYRMDGPCDPARGLLFDKSHILLDPYARAVTGQSEWGKPALDDFYKARVVENDFDWGGFYQPPIPMANLVIYEAHVRGFTRHPSAGVENPGTFSGLVEKIPYLKGLGVNAVELMPIFEFDEMRAARTVNGSLLLDYWGYNSVCFFAPNTGYTAELEYNREGTSLKKMIRALKENGIEVILDVVFNHTAEGDENGPCFCFKGMDNNVYYMLTPDGRYYNFSGCGNTLNCNHPIVQQMILECLRYWVVNYRVDGFRFDLASILGRNQDGSPMNKPPLLESLAFDPILSGVKLIAEAWDAGGLYQVGTFPAWNRWAEWNGRYRDDLRAFLKGDGGCALAAANRIAGSPDIYDPERRANASVNFITCHDGFTLRDLYSYNQKHNEKNGWNNTDGTDDNRSWNCGAEGETDDTEILALRRRLAKNAMAVLLCSRGTPMLLAGDEFGNTQQGNNNPYCQDNEISWLNWALLQEAPGKDMFHFTQALLAFRQAHPVIRMALAPSATGFPDISYHGELPFAAEYTAHTRLIGVMFAGKADDEREDIVYIGINAYWEGCAISLPKLPDGYHWQVAVNTGAAVHTQAPLAAPEAFYLGPRSVAVLCATQNT